MEFQDISSPQGSFTFVFIPARDAEPLAERTASLAGGLEDEQVQKVAKLHFFGETPLMFQMVDICTVYLPSPSNGYIGVSLYSHADSALPVNGRATKIAKACGHSATVVYGDAFISRCYDNEEEPWMRRDLFASEVCEEADWVIEAGASNRGRNMDAYTSGGSAGKVVHQMMDGTHTGRPAESAAAEGGTSLVRWTQTNDDIEIKISVPPETTAKFVNIKIKANSIYLLIPGLASPSEGGNEAELILKGGEHLLHGSVHPDECTWSLEGSAIEKFVTITLEKTSSKVKWPRLTKEPAPLPVSK